jgi:hypothetical protein
MKVAVLTANLGSFDTGIPSKEQILPRDVEAIRYWEFTDTDFPPIEGLSPRLQYRIPKMFGFEMIPDYMYKPDIIVWHDASMSFQREDSIAWLLEQLGDGDAAFFEHPWRSSIEEEVNHIEQKLQEGNKYITSRYKNGLHKEMYELIKKDYTYRDNWLFASTAFIYRNTPNIKRFMKDWFFYQARYYTCDQVHLPYVMYKNSLDINVINENVFKCPYISLVSKHS